MTSPSVNGTKKEEEEKGEEEAEVSLVATQITMNAAAVAVWSQLNGFFSQKKEKEVFSRLKTCCFTPNWLWQQFIWRPRHISAGPLGGDIR